MWKLWHGDTHLIVDDKKGWKKSCPTFKYVIDNGLCTNLSYPYEAMDGSCNIEECDPVVNISTYYDVRSDNERALMMQLHYMCARTSIHT